MALAIYKPGQGKYTRVLSAVGAGVLVLAGAAWLWAEIPAILGPTVLRTDGTELGKLTVDYVQNTTDGSRLKLVVGPETAAAIEEHGASQLKLISPGVDADLSETATFAYRSPIDANAGVIDLVQPLSNDFPANSTLSTTGSDYLLYTQAGSSVLLIAAASAILYYVLNRPRIVDFMIATEAEMRKVNWPTKREISGSTVVVILGTMLLASMLFVVDIAFAWLFQLVGVLEGTG